jgi:hypothetical protein
MGGINLFGGFSKWGFQGIAAMPFINETLIQMFGVTNLGLSLQ